MLNDRTGDCSLAAAAHLIEEWTSQTGADVKLTDDDVMGAYRALSGYDPATGENDHGVAELDVLNYWRKHGIGSRFIEAYVALEPHNHEHIRDAINLFGGCMIGLKLPTTAQSQVTWAVPPGGPVGRGAPGSWGGHAAAVVAYNERRVSCVSWGSTKQMTWEFLDAYCDEAYAVLSPDWFTGEVAPVGLDIETLRADLALVAGRPAPAAGQPAPA